MSEEERKDGSMFISFGLVLSLPYNAVERVRALVEEAGAKIIYQTTGASDLFLLRERQVERIIKKGDVSELKVIYERKQRGPQGPEIHQEERRVEK